MQTVSVWIRSKTAPFIEMIGGPDLQPLCEYPVVNAPAVTDLSNSRLGIFLKYLQGFVVDDEATKASIGCEVGLLELCIVNSFSNDDLEGEMPVTANSVFWQDIKHIRPIDEVVPAVRRCVELLKSRNPQLINIVAALPKGSHGTEQSIHQEILGELQLLDRHLTWIFCNRVQAVVSMLWEI